MVKQRKKNNRKKRSSKGFTANSAKARKIKKCNGGRCYILNLRQIFAYDVRLVIPVK